MLNFPAILYINGWILLALGLSMILPAGVSLFYGEEGWQHFLGAGMLTLFLGGSLVFMNKGRPLTLSHRDGFLVTTLAWVLSSVFAAVPFLLSGVAPTFPDAFFEAVSGLTTTGATVFVGLDQMDHGILFWRAMLHFLGGMGIIVFALAVLPFLGIGGMQLYKAEVSGVTKDKLQPRLKETARSLWRTYLILNLACAIAFYAAGMEPFDALCHAMGTIATGGFANYDTSIGYYNSAVIDWVVIVFMFLGGVNFGLHYLAIVKRQPLTYFSDMEFRAYAALFFWIAFAISLVLVAHGTYDTFNEAFRKALFTVVSLGTTTGFVSGDYNVWPVFGPMMILLVTLLGGCGGSTSGGLKVIRLIIMLKQGQKEMHRLLHPHGVMNIKIGTHTLPPQVVKSVWSFASVYFGVFLLISILMTALDYDIVTSFTATAATLANAGPGLGSIVGPAGNFEPLSGAAKMLLSFSMLIGRLEVITFLILFTPSYWKT